MLYNGDLHPREMCCPIFIKNKRFQNLEKDRIQEMQAVTIQGLSETIQ